MTGRSAHTRAEKSNLVPYSTDFGRTIKVILDPDPEALLDILAQALQALQIYSNALNCLGLLPFLLLFLLLDSTNLIRAYYKTERKRERLINCSLDATRSMQPLSVVYWPLLPLP